jgi:hypothetical protein
LLTIEILTTIWGVSFPPFICASAVLLELSIIASKDFLGQEIVLFGGGGGGGGESVVFRVEIPLILLFFGETSTKILISHNWKLKLKLIIFLFKTLITLHQR